MNATADAILSQCGITLRGAGDWEGGRTARKRAASTENVRDENRKSPRKSIKRKSPRKSPAGAGRKKDAGADEEMLEIFSPDVAPSTSGVNKRLICRRDIFAQVDSEDDEENDEPYRLFNL